MRVAVAQFATSSNSQENLTTCIRMISAATICKPLLIVLPEYCNTQPWYVDHHQAWNEALTINGVFLQGIAEQARKHDCYIVINVTLQRDISRDFSNNKQDGSIKSNISVTSCIFSPLGKLVSQVDKQTLTELESHFFTRGSNVTKVVTTSLGKLGMLMGNDGLTFEASRELALDNAQLLCNSINSFALDQSRLHDPTRAFENNVFIATANKIGSLYSQGKLQGKPQKKFKVNQHEIPEEYMFGIGQSQIVSPSGEVLAKLTNNEEGFIFADINLTEAGIASNNKFRPDGTEFFKQRRAELYQELIQPTKIKPSQEQVVNNKVPVTANIAIFATYKSNEQAIDDVCHYIENNLSDIIQLPELFFIADKTIDYDAEQLVQISSLSQ